MTPHPSAARPPSWRRQGSAPPAGKNSPLKMAISQFKARTAHRADAHNTLFALFAKIFSAKIFLRVMNGVGKGVTALCLCRPNLRESTFAEKLAARTILLQLRAARETEHKAEGDCWVFLKLTTFSFVSSKEKV